MSLDLTALAIGGGAALTGGVLLVQGLRAYSGTYRRWLDDRVRISGWGGLGLLWFSLSPLSFLAAMIARRMDPASPLSVVFGLGFLGIAPIGMCFTYLWMPRFLLPGWVRRPLDAGLEMTNLADLERWEELVVQGWSEREAADHVKATSVLEGRRDSRVSIYFDSRAQLAEFERLIGAGMTFDQAAVRCQVTWVTDGLAVEGKPGKGVPTDPSDAVDFKVPVIYVNGQRLMERRQAFESVKL